MGGWEPNLGNLGVPSREHEVSSGADSRLIAIQHAHVYNWTLEPGEEKGRAHSRAAQEVRSRPPCRIFCPALIHWPSWGQDVGMHCCTLKRTKHSWPGVEGSRGSRNVSVRSKASPVICPTAKAISAVRHGDRLNVGQWRKLPPIPLLWRNYSGRLPQSTLPSVTGELHNSVSG